MRFRRICVFCGSSSGLKPVYSEAATNVGSVLASRKIGLVYGGGGVGLMGIAANAARAGGGEVIGVIPRALHDREVALDDLDDLRIVSNMHERKALMADLSDGFIALPGGLGTLEELFEVLTWSQLGFHVKPVGILDVAGYFAGVQAQLDHAVNEGFLHPAHRQALLFDEDVEALLDRMAEFAPPEVDKWWIEDDVR